MQTVYGAFEQNTLVGMIATRGDHISLFFVRGKYHRQGYGRKLFAAALRDSKADRITVNSSPYAVEVYRRLGFRPLSEEQTQNGIRFTPMALVR